MKWIMNTILGVLFFFVVFAVGLKLMENSMVFYPAKYPTGWWEPARFGLTVEDCYFTTKDGVKLHGWFIPRAGARQTLLYCHGNGGNITYFADYAEWLLSGVQAQIFLFDYRGYGRSDGAPDEAGVYQDARAAYDYLLTRPDVNGRKIVLFGQSLGGAVAVDLALDRPCTGLILESTFTSAKNMAKKAFPFLPVSLIIGVKFDSEAKITRLRLPLLIAHGTADRTVPFKLGRRLFEVANEPKEFYAITGADHNNPHIAGGETYLTKLREFIERLP
jgi:hypothetical protein